MLGSVKVLTRELTHARGNSLVQPSLLEPPGVEPACIRAGQPAGVGEQTEICTEISAGLPECRRMKKQSVQAGQRAKIDVNRSPKPVPTRESLLLLALNVPERIADVVKIESDASLQ